MKRALWISLALTAACVVQPPLPTPERPRQTLVVHLVDQTQAALMGTVSLDELPTPIVRETDGLGRVEFNVAPGPRGLLACAEFFDCQRVEAIDNSLLNGGATSREITVALKRSHVDPSGIPLEQLAAIRGAMWPLGPLGSTPASATLQDGSTCAPDDIPFGPRWGSRDNVIATDFFANYSPHQQACIIAELKARGYRDVVVGPLVDSDGYRGMWQPSDWRGANFEKFLDILQTFWDHGLAPIVFIHPDGWSFERTRDELTPLLQQPRAQRLIRKAVPSGWEPAKYEWSSCTWREFGKWGRAVLPNALILLHTVPDVDAPGGTDERCDDNGAPGGNAAVWARVVPYLHGWLTQSTAFDAPDAHGDANHPEKTNFENWQDLFRCAVPYSYCNRFTNGFAGWPTRSAWGENKPIRLYGGEYAAYWKFWHGRTEAESVRWGDAAIAAGADGYLDSGSMPVPVRQ